MNSLLRHLPLLALLCLCAASPTYAVIRLPGPAVQAVAKAGYTSSTCDKGTVFILAGGTAYFSTAGSSDQDYYSDPYVADDLIASEWERRKDGESTWTAVGGGSPASISFPAGKYYVRAIVDDKHANALCSDDVNTPANSPAGHPGSYASNEITVYSVSGELKAVTFFSDHGTLASDAGAVFDPRGWSDVANNPVSYTMGNTAIANVKLCVKPSGLNYTLTGSSSTQALSFAYAGLGTSDTDTQVAMTALSPLPAQVDVLAQSIAWNASDFLELPGVTLSLGSSGAHKVYVTLANPTTSPLYETLVHVTCNAAKGYTTAAAVKEAIWGKFASKSVSTVNGTVLKYYGNGWLTPGGSSTASLLANGDGRCGDWASFYIDCTKSQGLAGVQRMSLGFISRQCDENGHTYRSVAFYMNPSMVGQGGTTPPTRFTDHCAIVQDQIAIYDPSYGMGPYDTFLSYLDGCIWWVPWVNEDDDSDVIYKRATDYDFYVSVQ